MRVATMTVCHAAARFRADTRAVRRKWHRIFAAVPGAQSPRLGRMTDDRGGRVRIRVCAVVDSCQTFPPCLFHILVRI